MGDAATLDRFLAAPMKAVPGTKMVIGIADPAKYAQAIAYLRAEGAKHATTRSGPQYHLLPARRRLRDAARRQRPGREAGQIQCRALLAQLLRRTAGSFASRGDRIEQIAFAADQGFTAWRITRRVRARSPSRCRWRRRCPRAA
ncbi:c-type cytochrome [Sphingomonas sp. MMS24-JH45]